MVTIYTCLAVHQLSPYDVDVVGALGDSVTVSLHGKILYNTYILVVG